MSHLFVAAALNKVERLRAAPEPLTSTDSRGWTALFFAAESGAVEAATVLLELGLDPNAIDRSGLAPMQYAVHRGHPEVVKLLRARGGDPLLGAAQLARSMGGARAELFADLPADLPPAPKKEVVVMTSGRLPDPPPNAKWQDEHERLWKLLVPPRNEAPTLQGEFIRCTGKLADEAYRNGNINWGPRYEVMCRFLGDRLADKTVFGADEVLKLREAIGQIKREHDTPDLSGAGSTYYRLSEAAVRYCHAKPELIPWTPEPPASARPPVVRKRK